jgi:acetyl esterase/lipase
VKCAYDGLLSQGYAPEYIASIGHSIGGNLRTGLVVGLRDEGRPLRARWSNPTLGPARFTVRP